MPLTHGYEHTDAAHDDHGGLQRDLIATGTAIDRRGMLRLSARIGVVFSAWHLVGCGSSATAPSGTSSTTAATGNAACSRVPEETQGPYPGDGSNGPNVLNQSGVVRPDIAPSFAGLSGAADGVPMTLELTIVSASTCAVLAGRAVYVWHCDRLGRYSLYDSALTSQNYLRGVQEADANGRVTFTSIFPGCYSGRWPHIHFEVYPSLAAATSVANKIATSQIALPKAACDTIYGTSAYATSATNLSRISLATDGVFSDGSALELATVNGGTAGVTASLTVAI